MSVRHGHTAGHGRARRAQRPVLGHRSCSTGWTTSARYRPGPRSSTGSRHSARTIDGRPAWHVELRARLGPMARSKRLRMVRTVHDAPSAAVFERAELDGRKPLAVGAHGRGPGDGDDECELDVDLHYGGSLWTGGLLERALTDQIEQGRERLRRAGHRAYALSRPFGRRSRCSWDPEALRQTPRRSACRRSGPAPSACPSRSSERVGHPRRHLVDVVGDQHQRGSGRVVDQFAERCHQCSRPPRSSRALGSSSSTMPGIVHQRAGEHDALLLARRQRAPRPLGEACRRPSVRDRPRARAWSSAS